MKKNIIEIVTGYFSSLLMLIVVVLIVSFKQNYDGQIDSIRVGFVTIIVLGSMGISFVYLILLLPMMSISYFIQHLKHSQIILNLCSVFLIIIIILFIIDVDMDSDLLIYSIPIVSHFLRAVLIVFRSL